MSRRGYQTLILKSRDKKLRLTINSFNLHRFFSPVVALEDNDDFDPTTDTNYFLIMLVFVISETWGYRLGLEIIIGWFCGKLLCLRKITKCYQKWHEKFKIENPSSNLFLTTGLLLSQCPKVRTSSQPPTTRVRTFSFRILLFIISTVMKSFYAQNWLLFCIICLIIYQASWYFASAKADVKNVAGMFRRPSGFGPP